MRATVVIPCYRPDEHFEKVLSDLNAQTSQDFEVIFADDGNDPPLKPRIDAVLRRPFQVIRFETNQGIVAGLNACVQAVTTPYIIRMDADDRMPSLLAVLVLLCLHGAGALVQPSDVVQRRRGTPAIGHDDVRFPLSLQTTRRAALLAGSGCLSSLLVTRPTI